MGDLVLMGYVSRAFGIKGGVAVKLINENSLALAVGKAVTLKGQGLSWQTLFISELIDQNRIFFAGIDNRNKAEALKGAELWIERSDLPPLDDDEFYLTDLMGAQVLDSTSVLLGTIVGFSSNTAQTLFEMKTTAGTIVAIPAIKPIVQKIDVAQKLVVIDPPMGLLNLADK